MFKGGQGVHAVHGIGMVSTVHHHVRVTKRTHEICSFRDVPIGDISVEGGCSVKHESLNAEERGNRERGRKDG